MGESVGAGVVSTTGVSPVGETEGTAPPGGEDVQPAMSRARTSMHTAERTNGIFIRVSPLLTRTDTRDDIYGFIWNDERSRLKRES
jgi:hypothetical protein